MEASSYRPGQRPGPARQGELVISGPSPGGAATPGAFGAIPDSGIRPTGRGADVANVQADDSRQTWVGAGQGSG